MREVPLALLVLAWCAPLRVAGVATSQDASNWMNANTGLVSGYQYMQPHPDDLAIAAADQAYLADRTDDMTINNAEDKARALTSLATRSAVKAVQDAEWLSLERSGLRLRAEEKAASDSKAAKAMMADLKYRADAKAAADAKYMAAASASLMARAKASNRAAMLAATESHIGVEERARANEAGWALAYQQPAWNAQLGLDAPVPRTDLHATSPEVGAQAAADMTNAASAAAETAAETVVAAIAEAVRRGPLPVGGQQEAQEEDVAKLIASAHAAKVASLNMSSWLMQRRSSADASNYRAEAGAKLEAEAEAFSKATADAAAALAAQQKWITESTMPGVATNSKDMKRQGDAKAAAAAAAVMHAHALAVRMTRAAKAASSALNGTKVSGDADTKLAARAEQADAEEAASPVGKSAPSVGTRKNCVSLVSVATDDWCIATCALNTCPPNMCKCGDGVVSAVPARKAWMKLPKFQQGVQQVQEAEEPLPASSMEISPDQWFSMNASEEVRAALNATAHTTTIVRHNVTTHQGPTKSNPNHGHSAGSEENPHLHFDSAEQQAAATTVLAAPGPLAQAHSGSAGETPLHFDSPEQQADAMLAGTSGHVKPQPQPHSAKAASAGASGNGVWHSATPPALTADMHQVRAPVIVDDLSEPVPGDLQTLESIGAARFDAKPMPLATNAEGEAAAKRIAEAVAMARVQVEMRSLARAKVAADASAKAAADLHQMSDDLHQMSAMGQMSATATVDAAVEAQAYAAAKKAATDAEDSSDRVTAEAARAVAQAAADVQASVDPAQMASAMAVAEAAMVAATTSTGGKSAAIASYHSGDVPASAAALKTKVVPDTRPWYETRPIGDRLVEPKAAALPDSVIGNGKAMSAADARAMKVQLAALQARKQRLRSAMEGFKYLASPSSDDTERYKMAVAKFKQIDDKVKNAKGLLGTKDHADRFGSAKDQISLLAGVSPLRALRIRPKQPAALVPTAQQAWLAQAKADAIAGALAEAKDNADAVAKANMKAKGIIAPPVKAAAASQGVQPKIKMPEQQLSAAMNEIFGASTTPAASPKQPTTRTPTRTPAQEQLSEALADVDAAAKASFSGLDTKSSGSKVASDARAAMAKAANMANARAKAGTALRERAATKGGAAASKGAQGGVPSAAVWFAKKKPAPAAKAQVGAVATWRPPRSGNNNNKAAQAKLLHNAAPNAAAPNGNAAPKAAPAVAAASMTKRKAAAKAKALAEAKAVAAKRENAGNAGMSALAITAKQQANVNAGWNPHQIERKFERTQANAVNERANAAMEAANLPKKPLRVDIGGAQGQPAGGKAHALPNAQNREAQKQANVQKRALAEEQKRANTQLALRQNRTHPDVPETWHDERRERDANAGLGGLPAALPRRGVMNAKMTENNKVELSLEDFRELVGAKATASEDLASQLSKFAPRVAVALATADKPPRKVRRLDERLAAADAKAEGARAEARAEEAVSANVATDTETATVALRQTKRASKRAEEKARADAVADENLATLARNRAAEAEEDAAVAETHEEKQARKLAEKMARRAESAQKLAHNKEVKKEAARAEALEKSREAAVTKAAEDAQEALAAQAETLAAQVKAATQVKAEAGRALLAEKREAAKVARKAVAKAEDVPDPDPETVAQSKKALAVAMADVKTALDAKEAAVGQKQAVKENKADRKKAAIARSLASAKAAADAEAAATDAAVAAVDAKAAAFESKQHHVREEAKAAMAARLAATADVAAKAKAQAKADLAASAKRQKEMLDSKNLADAAAAKRAVKAQTSLRLKKGSSAPWSQAETMEEEEEEEEEPSEEKPTADTVKTAADVNAASRQNLDAESEEGMEEEELEEEDSVVDVTMDEEEEAPVKQRATPVYAATTPPVPRAYAARAKVAAEVRRLDKVNVDQATANARHVKATMRKAAEASAKVAEASVSRQNAHAGVKLSQKAAPKPVAPKPVAPKPVALKPVAPKPVAPKPVAPKPVAKPAAKPVAKAAPNGQHLAGTPTNAPHGIARVNPSQ